MADSSMFPPKTLFNASVQLDGEQGTVYGTIQFRFDPADYPAEHTITTSDIAGAIRDAFTAHGYTMTDFWGDISSSAALDWPQGD